MQKPKWYLTFSASAAGNDWIHANPVARGINRWRARCPESGHAGFGGRLHRKGPHPHGIRDLAVQPTLPGVTTCQGGREGRPQGKGAQVIGYSDRKACVMQSAETVLDVLRDRGRKGLPCNEL